MVLGQDAAGPHLQVPSPRMQTMSSLVDTVVIPWEIYYSACECILCVLSPTLPTLSSIHTPYYSDQLVPHTLSPKHWIRQQTMKPNGYKHTLWS